MDKVRFNVQQVLTDDVLGIRARVRVRVDEPWATVTAKVAEKLRAAAEADGGTEAEGSTEAARRSNLIELCSCLSRPISLYGTSPAAQEHQSCVTPRGPSLVYNFRGLHTHGHRPV